MLTSILLLRTWFSNLTISCPTKFAWIPILMLEFTNAYTFESEYSNTTTVHIDGFRVRARDISYAFRKKSGFLQFEDKGLLDVYVFTICIELMIVGSKRYFRGNKINGKSPDIKQRRFLLPSRQSLSNNQPFQLLPPTIRAQHPCNPLIPLRQTHHPCSTPTSPRTRN